MKHKLKPLKEKEENVCSTTRICFVDGKEFLKGMTHEHMCFSIIPKDSKEEVKEVPVEVANMLGEFSNIVSDNVLDGLPRMREISHQMDLVPGASFPNKVTHRMTPVESEELNRKVHELLQKGLIREILSPCFVPTILAPKKNGK